MKKHPSCEVPELKTVPNSSAFIQAVSTMWILRSSVPPSSQSSEVSTDLSNQTKSLVSLQDKYNTIKGDLAAMTCPLSDIEDKDAT